MQKIIVLNFQDGSVDILDVDEKLLTKYDDDIEAFLSINRGYNLDEINWMEGVNSINFITFGHEQGTEDESGS